MAALVCLDDYEQLAKDKLDRNAYNYYSSGANNQQTLRDNVQAFKRYRLRPRFLRDVSNIQMETIIQGDSIPFPICVAPTAMQKMAHVEGELATARASLSLGTCMVLSSWSSCSIEEVAEASGSALRWFQLYVYRDRKVTEDLVRRAEQCGYRAIVVTVDTPEVGKRLNDTRYRFILPSHISLANFRQDFVYSSLSDNNSQHGSSLYNYTVKLMDNAVTWKDINWLRSITSLPIILKGVLTKEDVQIALQHGVKGIVVSNHGARQLDGVPATIDVLKEIVDGVEGKCEVYLDGGVRLGTDVLKALALGARAVFIGRPVLWGLACNGQPGVESVIGILRDEFKQSMALSGCRNLSDISQELIVKETVLNSKL